MKKILILSGFLIFSMLFFSCEDSLEDSVYKAYEDEPAATWLDNQPQFSEYVKLLRRANYFNALNVKMDLTCFVADNDAVKEYLTLKGANTVDDLDISTVNYLVRFHTIPGVKYTHEAFTGKLADSTATGDYLTIKPGDEGGLTNILVNDYARIVRRDIETVNATVHILDKLLDPIIETVADIIAANERYSIFSEALEYCELDALLSEKYRLVGVTSIKDYKTVFVVSDSVFRLNGIDSFEQLKASYPDSALYNFIAYHIINENYDYGDLATFESKPVVTTRRNISTYAKNQLISVADINSEIIINDGSEEIRLVRGRYDKQGSNGFVHEIDKLMDIAEPAACVFSWGFMDIIDCRILPAYKKYDGSTVTYNLDYENLQEIRWETVPAKNNAGRYQLRDDGGNNRGNEYFLINLGYVGWIEFDIPVIAKGTYRMQIYRKVYPNNRGTCYLYFDGKKNSTTISSQTGNKPFVADNQTFEVQEPHVIKFTAFKPGDLDLDYILFTPIN